MKIGCNEIKIGLIFWIILIPMVVIGQTSGRKKGPSTEQLLDKKFAQAIVDYNIPGMAVVIVKDGQIMLSKGYGVKNTLTNEPVDDHTLFAIASNTKAFTAAALAMLVDEGKLTWEDRVKDYLPYFELYDPYVSNAMTIRDLLCHRSGLATFSGDLIWYGSNHSREEVIKRAKFLRPVYGFRESYGYSNIMYLVAGEVIAQVSGMSWESFIEQRLFHPLNMKDSNTSIRKFKNGGNIASPHNEVDEKNIPIDYVNWDNINAAGSINASVADLSQWLLLQLNRGTLNQHKFWTEARTYEMWENYSPKPITKWQRENMPTRHFNGYGLGWDLMDYGGMKVVSHGGGYDGMISKTVLVPEINLGFVILTNTNNSLPSALAFDILDEYLGVRPNTDWMQLFLSYKKREKEASIIAEHQDSTARLKHTTPSLPLAEYAGVYRSEMYGDVEITLSDSGQLLIDFKPTPLFKGKLAHWHLDTFQLTWTTQMMLPKGKATFVINSEGQVEELKVVVDNPDFDFTELKLVKHKTP